MSSELENYIRNNADELDRKKPDTAILGRILEDMKAAGKEKPKAIMIPIRLLKWAAACLLVTVCGLAVWYFNKPPQPTHGATANTETGPLPAPKIDPVQHAPVDIAVKHIATNPPTVLRNVKKEKTAILSGLSNMQSAASRINAIASTSRMENKGNEVVDALVQTLNNDPNANVRLAALNALTRLHTEPNVRRELAASLNKQQDPLVQINLIDMLAGMQEFSALSDLEKMANDENMNKTVRDVAWAGIMQLRHR